MQEQTCNNIHPSIQPHPPSPPLSLPPQTVVRLKSCCFPMFQQMTVVETVAEVKAAGSVDSSLTTTTESTAKPPPFKDPSFMVSVCVRLVQGQPVSYFLSSLSGFAFFFYSFVLAALRDWWSGSRQKEPDLEEPQTDSGFGADATLEAQWSQLWVFVFYLTHYMLFMFFISICSFQLLEYIYITYRITTKTWVIFTLGLQGILPFDFTSAKFNLKLHLINIKLGQETNTFSLSSRNLVYILQCAVKNICALPCSTLYF